MSLYIRESLGGGSRSVMPVGMRTASRATMIGTRDYDEEDEDRDDASDLKKVQLEAASRTSHNTSFIRVTSKSPVRPAALEIPSPSGAPTPKSATYSPAITARSTTLLTSHTIAPSTKAGIVTTGAVSPPVMSPKIHVSSPSMLPLSPAHKLRTAAHESGRMPESPMARAKQGISGLNEAGGGRRRSFFDAEHDDICPNVNIVSTYKCPRCSKQFANITDMSLHARTCGDDEDGFTSHMKSLTSPASVKSKGVGTPIDPGKGKGSFDSPKLLVSSSATAAPSASTGVVIRTPSSSVATTPTIEAAKNSATHLGHSHEVEQLRSQKATLEAAHLESERRRFEEELNMKRLNFEREKLEAKLHMEHAVMENERLKLKLQLERELVEAEMRKVKDEAERNKAAVEIEHLKAQLEKEKSEKAVRELEAERFKREMLERESKTKQMMEEAFAISSIGTQSINALAAAVASSSKSHGDALWKVPAVADGDVVPCAHCVDTKEYTAVSMAAFYGHKECLEALVASGADFTSAGADGQTPVHHASTVGHVDCLSALIKLGADYTSLDCNGRTCLFLATAANQFHSVAALIEVMAEWVDYPDMRGDTPLHAACCNGYAEIVQLLLSARANPNIPNAAYLTPVHLASNLASLTAVVSAGSDIFTVDETGRSPIFITAAYDKYDMLEYLLKTDTNRYLIDYGDLRGDTPLHAASCNGGFMSCQLLLQYGCNPSPTNVSGFTPINLALANGNNEVAAMIQGTLVHWMTNGWELPPSAGSPGGAVDPTTLVNFDALIADGTAPPPIDAISSTTASDTTSEWSMLYDPKSGYNYYVSAITGESTWEVPPGYSVTVTASDGIAGERDTRKTASVSTTDLTGAPAFETMKGGPRPSTTPDAITTSAEVREDGKRKPPRRNKDYVTAAQKYRDEYKYLKAGMSSEATVTCIVCNKRLVESLFLPCEHACVCNKCIKKHAIGPYPDGTTSAVAGHGVPVKPEGLPPGALAGGAVSGSESEIEPGAKDKSPWKNCPCCMVNISQVVDLVAAQKIPRAYGPARKLQEEFKSAFAASAGNLKLHFKK